MLPYQPNSEAPPAPAPLPPEPPLPFALPLSPPPAAVAFRDDFSDDSSSPSPLFSLPREAFAIDFFFSNSFAVAFSSSSAVGFGFGVGVTFFFGVAEGF